MGKIFGILAAGASAATLATAAGLFDDGVQGCEIINGRTFLVQNDGTSVLAPGLNIDNRGNCSDVDLGSYERVDIEGAAAQEFADHMAEKSTIEIINLQATYTETGFAGDFEDRFEAVVAVNDAGTISLVDQSGETVTGALAVSYSEAQIAGFDSVGSATITYDTEQGLRVSRVPAFTPDQM